MPITSQQGLFHSQTHVISIDVHVWAQVKVDAQNLQLMKDYGLRRDQNTASHTVSSYFRGLNAKQLGLPDLHFMFEKTLLDLISEAWNLQFI